jgi:AcrR family transcriptional regulator
MCHTPVSPRNALTVVITLTQEAEPALTAPTRRGEPGTRRRPGGRTARATQAILTAVVEELAGSGYAALSLDRVAARAGVHRATVYRRWASKESLVADAVLASAARDVPLPDTGTVRGDLRELTHAIVANLSSPVTQALLRTLVSESGRVPGIDAVAESFWAERFALAGAVIQRGITRGELPPSTDPDFLIEMLIAPLYLRVLVTGRPLTTGYSDRVTSAVLGPV